MNVTVKDESLFGRLTMTIELESIKEIYWLIPVFNACIDKHRSAIPDSLSPEEYQKYVEGIELVNIGLWNAVEPIYKKLLLYKGHQ